MVSGEFLDTTHAIKDFNNIILVHVLKRVITQWVHQTKMCILLEIIDSDLGRYQE